MCISTKILLSANFILLFALCLTISLNSKKIKSLRYDVDDLSDQVDCLENKLDDIGKLAAEGECLSYDVYYYGSEYYYTNFYSIMENCKCKFYEIKQVAQY